MTLRIVVTGAAGMAGQNLVPRLVSARHDVIAIDRSGPALDVLERRAPGVRSLRADLSEPGAWEAAFGHADAVVDLKAQITSPEWSEHDRHNTQATREILRACAAARVPHLVHLSSSVVISKADDFYTRSKRAGEDLVHASNVPRTILRPPLMHGPGDIKHLGLIVRLMERLPAIPVPGRGRFLRQPLYVGDLCAVIESCLARGPRTETVNVIGHERIEFIDLLRRIRGIRRLRCLLLPVSLGFFRTALGLQTAVFGRALWTRQQLDALVAGDDFPVEDWCGRFGVSYTSFDATLRTTYVDADALRRELFEARSRASHPRRTALINR